MKKLPQLTDFGTTVQFKEYLEKHSEAEHPYAAALVETGVDILSSRIVSSGVETGFQIGSILRPMADSTTTWSEQRLRELETWREQFPEHQRVVFAGDDDHLYQALGTGRLIQTVDNLGQAFESGKRSLAEMTNRSLGFDTGKTSSATISIVPSQPRYEMPISLPPSRPKLHTKDSKSSVSISVAGGVTTVAATLSTNPLTIGAGAVLLGGMAYLNNKKHKKKSEKKNLLNIPKKICNLFTNTSTIYLMS